MNDVTVTVFLRFDDYSETSQSTVERGLVDSLRRAGACATFAVIPAVTEGSYHQAGERPLAPLGPDKAAFLRQSSADGVVDVALHGWNHRTVREGPPHSEFVGVPLDEQVAKIRQGRQLLADALGMAPTVFVPPWNRYDASTIQALEHNRLSCLSANRYGPACDTALRLVPITADLQELRSAVAAARASRDPDPIVGILLHPYDFADSGDARGVWTWEALDRELTWLVAQPDVRVATVSQLAEREPVLSRERFRSNQPSSLESCCPPFLQTIDQTPFFRSTREATRIKNWHAIVTTLTLVAAFVAGALASAAAPALGMDRPRPMAAITLGLATLLLVRARAKGGLFFRAVFAVAFLAGVGITTLVRS